MDLSPLLDSAGLLRLQTALICYSIFAGCVGWDVVVGLPFDLQLLRSPGWSSAVRAVSRIAYLCSRWLALIALALCIRMLGWPSSDAVCNQLPRLIEGTLAASYVCTVTVLFVRTLALYPGHTRSDWLVAGVLFLGWLSILACGIAAPFFVEALRPPGLSARCTLHQRNSDDTAVDAVLSSIVAFDCIILALTVKKMYTAPDHKFFASASIFSRLCPAAKGSAKHSTPDRPNRIAVDLLEQGLYDFSLLTVSAIAALACWKSNLPSVYRAVSVLGLGAVSAALAGGVFRETTRAATALREAEESKVASMTQLRALHERITRLEQQRAAHAGGSLSAGISERFDSEKPSPRPPVSADCARVMFGDGDGIQRGQSFGSTQTTRSRDSDLSPITSAYHSHPTSPAPLLPSGQGHGTPFLSLSAFSASSLPPTLHDAGWTREEDEETRSLPFTALAPPRRARRRQPE
ncbi:hypothetical protein FA09DRAFT_324987 [Tilletiopsis washingtonensis]|jgi:hypothetical protein|uniref:Uncharacterized protein n=1 Tax=Tilletiopsis washingtonensis TaxID=58919 RepID=A0A316ZCD4_9BASI|nr:hypothetical protein FA09DRAFT_324987 [Tilletiopsis washingtonensis]PWN98976.1 hypothetical protein FA09DRAFT_324987 [Tilletiopsis washingtonensis]